MNDLFTDFGELFSKLPAWLVVLLTLTLLGVAWKKFNLPNGRWLFLVKIVLGMVSYPFLMWGPDVFKEHYNPAPVLIFQGLLIGICSLVFAEGIIAKLKQRFPSLPISENSEPPQTAKPKEP